MQQHLMARMVRAHVTLWDVYIVTMHASGILLITASNTNHTVLAIRLRSDTGEILKTKVLHSGVDTSGLNFKKRAGSSASASWDAASNSIGVS